MMLGTTTVSRVSFYEWVRDVAGESNARIAAKIGVDPSTVGGWQHRDPKARDVITFAKAYGRPITEALRQAFELTADDLDQSEPDPYTLSNAQLLAQLVYRLDIRVDELYEALQEGNPGLVAGTDRLSTQAHRPKGKD